MGKLLIVSISDHEEHIFNRVMAAIADEPDFDHIAPPQSSLSFSNLEILLKEHTVYCSGKLIPMTHHEFAVLTYLARHPGGYSQPARFMRPYGIETVNAAAPPLPVSSVRSGAS